MGNSEEIVKQDNTNQEAIISNLCGAIDSVINGKISGWVWGGNPDINNITVSLLDGDLEISQCQPLDFRPDLKPLGYADGYCGFSMELPVELFDGRQHDFHLICGSHPVPGGQKTIKLSRNLSSIRNMPIEGSVDAMSGGYIDGWVFDSGKPNSPVDVTLFINGKKTITDLADYYRKDLDKAGKINGYCAFHLPIHESYLDGRKLTVQVHETASEVILAGKTHYEAIETPTYNIELIAFDGENLKVNIDSTPSLLPELELWIDGIWNTQLDFPKQVNSNSLLLDFKCSIPPILLDGAEHKFIISPKDSRIVLSSALFTTPEKIHTYAILKASENRLYHSLPFVIDVFLSKIITSQLFDSHYYSEQVNKKFESDKEAALHYISNRQNWRHSTSPWLDIAFIRLMAGDIVHSMMSPLEWYIRQPLSSQAGPNPLFCNSDYQLFLDLPTDAKPQGSSYFDDWLEGVKQSKQTPPALLVDLEYISTKLGQPNYETDCVLNYLQDWLNTSPEKREVGLLHPYFDQTWLDQSFIIKHNQPKGCLLSAFRTGLMKGQSPHPVIQYEAPEKDFYITLRNYEALFLTSSIDDITPVCEKIISEDFYAQYPSELNDKGSHSSLRRYVNSASLNPHPSFIDGVEDDFISTEYPGLIEYCQKVKGIADINYIWARWLNLLQIPGNYHDAMNPSVNVLTLQNLAQLKAHTYQPELGISASFIIPSYARDDLALRCILSTIQSAGSNTIEFIIAEDAPHADCGWILGYFLPFAKLIANPKNLGFLLSCNHAVQQSSGDIFLLVNNDIIVHHNALNEMLHTFNIQPQTAVVGGLILNPDGSIQENAGMLWQNATAWNYHRDLKLQDETVFNVREADYISGCWIGVRRAVWDQLGGFDTRYVPAYCEESDFCMSCWQAGYKVIVNPLSVVTHLDGATMGQDENANTLKAYQKINRAKLLDKWQSILTTLHNPNGNLSPFHTGRRGDKRFITIVMDHYIPEPDRDAGSRTIFSICETLAAMENNYVLFVPANNYRSSYTANLERLGIEVITGVEGWKRFDNLLLNQKKYVKHILVSRISVAKNFSWHLDQLTCKKSLYIHDIETLRSFPHQPESLSHRELVNGAISDYVQTHQAIFSKFDHILSCSEDETQLLKPHFGEKVVDIFPYDHHPSLYDEKYTLRKDLIFIGSYNHPPNRDAIQYFLQYIWPQILHELPDTKLHLCGSGMQNARFLAGKNIILHGHVTDQTLTYLYSISRLSVAPLLTGAGIKGKVIEASAHGVACVGTEVAWQGLPLPQTYSYLSGSIETFATRLLQAYHAYGENMANTMITFHEACQKRHHMSEVIPKLVLSRRGR